MDYEALYDRLYRYCYCKLRHVQLAEDVTQEALLRWLNAGEKGGLAYLYAVARNLCIDHWRRCPEAPLEQELADGQEEQLILQTDLAQALDRLLPEERELILLRWVDGLPVGTIAKITGLSRFAVYRRIERCRTQLQVQLGKEYGL